MQLREMLVARANLIDDQSTLLNKAKQEKRGLTDAEDSEYQMMERRIARFEEDLRSQNGIPEVTGNFNDDFERWQREGIMERQEASWGRSSGNYRGRTADNETAITARYIRTGDNGALAEIRASNDTDMNITTDADGGFGVPTGHYQGVIAKMRPKALPYVLGVKEIPGVGTTVNVPVDAEGDDGAFVATNEASGFDRDAPALGQVPMTLVKYTKKVELSVELLEDEDSRLMDFINGYVADGMAATMNTLMITEALADGTAGLTLDGAAAITAAEVPELLYTLKSEYMNGNVSWLMRRETEGNLRGKTGDNFQFAPTPQGQTGSQGQLFGLPVNTNANMPAIGAGNKSLLIGNWGYMGMRLAPNLQFLRDPYTLGHLGQVRLLYFFRCDFEVLQAEAFQYATHPTA